MTAAASERGIELEINKALGLIVHPEQVFEVRSVCEHEFPSNLLFRGDDLAAAARRAFEQNEARNVYLTINPVDPALVLPRGEGVKDENIVARRFLFIDCDPVRPKGVSATDAEKEQARRTALDV